MYQQFFDSLFIDHVAPVGAEMANPQQKGKNAMTTQYHSQTAKFLATVAQNMPAVPASRMQYWIEHPEEVQKALARVFLFPPVWKAIKLGTGLKSSEDFCVELEKNGFQVSQWARDIMSQEPFTAAVTEEEANLVVLSVAELGFKEGARYDQICARGIEMGMELCPAEVGPQLRLQYSDQPLGEWLVIAMEAICDSHGYLVVFHAEHDDGGLWLHSYYGSPGDFFNADDRFVFRARKSSPLG